MTIEEQKRSDIALTVTVLKCGHIEVSQAGGGVSPEAHRLGNRLRAVAPLISDHVSRGCAECEAAEPLRPLVAAMKASKARLLGKKR